MKPAQFIYKTATPRSKVQFLVNAWTQSFYTLSSMQVTLD